MTPLDRLRIEKAAADCGFELTPLQKDDDALELRSAAFPEAVRVVALPEEVFRLTSTAAALLEAPGPGSLTFQGYDRLYVALQRASAVARTMPNRVADQFRLATGQLPKSTDAERLVVQRIGQGMFRDALLDYWQGQCCVTGLAEPALLRASHIKPWAKCATDDERLDVFNGLLLAPHVDALFDGGWISFADDGALLVSAALSIVARAQLGVSIDWRSHSLKPEHFKYLSFHREHELRGALTEI